MTGVLSSAWVLMLTALVIRCKLSGQPFPVLAKFSPFHTHLVVTDRMLQLSPVLALLALVLVGIAWWWERRFEPVRPVVLAVGISVLVSSLAIALNPGGYLSWFIS